MAKKGFLLGILMLVFGTIFSGCASWGRNPNNRTTNGVRQLKRRRKMLKPMKCFFSVLAMGSIFLSASCVGTPSLGKMDLTTKAGSSHIMNLRHSESSDSDLIRQGQQLMKKGFLDTSTQEYGYYLMRYTVEESRTESRESIVAAHASALFILPLFGMGTDFTHYAIEATLSIFNSNGILIDTFSKKKTFEYAARLYTGGNPTKRIQKEFRKLFGDVLQMASAQSAEINNALLASGPISPENEPAAREKIASSPQALAPQGFSRERFDYSSSYSSTITQTPAQSSTTTSSTPTLQMGTYAGNFSGQSATMNLGTGVVTFTISGQTASGSYRINGNQLTLSIVAGNGNLDALRGRTFVYTVTSDTSFSGNGETWVRTGF